MLIDRDFSWQGPCWLDIGLDSDYYMYYDPQAEAQCDECLSEAWERMTYGGWEFTAAEYLRYFFGPYFIESVSEGLNASFPLKDYFDAAH